VVKNKVSPPFKTAEFDILFGEGISRHGEIIDMGVNADILEKSGAWYAYNGEKIGQGRDNAREFLRENPELSHRDREQGARFAGHPAAAGCRARDKAKSANSKTASAVRLNSRSFNAIRLPALTPSYGIATASLKGRALRLLSARASTRAPSSSASWRRYEEVPGSLGASTRTSCRPRASSVSSGWSASVLHRRAGKLGASRIRQELQSKGLEPDSRSGGHGVELRRQPRSERARGGLAQEIRHAPAATDAS
jgi:hypothetical protein